MSFDATLVVLAAGMGSRFGGLKQIEAMGPGGEAILDFSVYDALEAGFNKVVFIIKHAIEKEFKETVGKRTEKIIDVEYAYQELDMLPEGFTCPEGREKPWGTSHAILCCKDIVKTPFAVINADDYYGKTAFKKIYDRLKKQNGNYCMVGYRLANTLTENGTVSRGVCEIKDGKLVEINERTKISDCKYTEDGVNWVELSPDQVVSMNFWGFTPDIFGYIEEGFANFLKQNINVPKCEYFLPLTVEELMKSGKKDVDVLVAEDRWYGVNWVELSPDQVVSMNFWGFTPDIFGYIEEGFANFLKQNINVPKCEYFLPLTVEELMKSGKKDVDVLVAEDRWYGVTYKEDAEGVRKALTQKVIDGEYKF